MQHPEEEWNRPAWQLPSGVARGTWDYVHEPSIAKQYDAFHDGHPLLELDRQLVLDRAERIRSGIEDRIPVAIDCGCGTGRVAVPLSMLGWRVVGIDLSQAMLEETAIKGVGEPAAASGLGLIRGNLAQLGFLKPQSIDLAYCLYSSLGMVRGRHHRRACLRHVFESLRSGGEFIVHVHNRGTWLRDPGGMRRWIADWWRSRRDPEWEFGDRVYAYRGLPSMYLHIYSERELRLDLQNAGFRRPTLLFLNRTSSGWLQGRLGSRWRAGGFIAIATKA
jgi:SAM-dependent methyltransferase